MHNVSHLEDANKALRSHFKKITPEDVDKILDILSTRLSWLTPDRIPLSTAFGAGLGEALEIMLKYEEGQKALATKYYYGNTLVHISARFDEAEALEIMLKHPIAQAALLRKMDFGFTPLHCAAYNDNHAALEVMFKYPNTQAALEIQDSDGLTPYQLAASRGNAKALQAMRTYLKDEQKVQVLSYNLCFYTYKNPTLSEFYKSFSLVERIALYAKNPIYFVNNNKLYVCALWAAASSAAYCDSALLGSTISSSVSAMFESMSNAVASSAHSL